VKYDKLCVYLILEYAHRGNLITYVNQTNRQVTYELDLLTKPKIGKVTRPRCLYDWWREARRLMTQLLYALECLHRLDVSHQDLSLENVFLDRDLNVKLTGFGSAKECREEMMLDLPPVCKLKYISPEYFKGNQKVNGKSNDMWGYGVILFKILFAVFPWEVPDGHENFKIVYDKSGGTKKLAEKDDLLSRAPKRVLCMFDQLFCSENKRMTVEDALQHQYITKMEDENDPCF